MFAVQTNRCLISGCRVKTGLLIQGWLDILSYFNVAQDIFTLKVKINCIDITNEACICVPLKLPQIKRVMGHILSYKKTPVYPNRYVINSAHVWIWANQRAG